MLCGEIGDLDPSRDRQVSGEGEAGALLVLKVMSVVCVSILNRM